MTQLALSGLGEMSDLSPQVETKRALKGAVTNRDFMSTRPIVGGRKCSSKSGPSNLAASRRRHYDPAQAPCR